MNNERIVFADYIRVIACFIVMLTHSAWYFYAADISGLASNTSLLANETNRFWVAFYDGFLGRASLTTFIVISAFLLVPMRHDTTMLQFYKRRFLHIVPPTLTFMLLYCLLPLLWNGMTLEQSVADLRGLPWNFPSKAGHLWYMYPLISLYIIIPIISPWLEKATKCEELTFIALFFVTTFLPFIHRFVCSEVWGESYWNPFHMLWYCSGFIGYFVSTHYIKTHLKWNIKRRFWIGLLCFLVGATFTGWSFWWKGTPGQIIETPVLEWAWEFCTPNIFIQTMGILLLATCIRQTKSPKLLISLSKYSFGMYLMHMFVLPPIASLLIAGNVVHPIIPVWAVIPVIAMMTFCCCAFITWLLSHIRGSKWIIGV